MTTHKQVTKALSNERVKTVRIYEENLCAAEDRLETVLLYKPRYAGAAILAISKTVMYDFHYSYMTEKFPMPNSCSGTLIASAIMGLM